MARVKRITANLPAGLLREAMEVTRKGVTDTLVEGLRMVRRLRAYEKAMALPAYLYRHSRKRWPVVSSSSRRSWSPSS